MSTIVAVPTSNFRFAAASCSARALLAATADFKRCSASSADDADGRDGALAACAGGSKRRVSPFFADKVVAMGEGDDEEETEADECARGSSAAGKTCDGEAGEVNS